MAQPSIWVIDDQPEADVIVAWLHDQGYSVSHVNFTTALRTPLSPGCPGLIVLELVQPAIGGLVLCWKLRSRTSAPILVYSRTRRSGDPDASRRLGASAFLHKSAPFAEFALKVETLLHAPPRPVAELVPPDQPVLRVGELVIDAVRFRAHLNEHPVDLTPTQLRILHVLARTPGRVVSFAELASSLWPNARGGHTARSLSAHVQHIRLKLRAASVGAPHVASVRGVGYALSPPTASSAPPVEYRGAA
jgi:DNA-binding response OmpR family regulator